MYPSLGSALDRQKLPLLIADPDVASWLASARDLDISFTRKLRFLALRRACGFDERTTDMKASISISISTQPLNM
jgi:hypothetical protein